MTECLNAVGFVFNSVKTYIKKDKSCKYTNYYCQYCAYGNKASCIEPKAGTLSPCSMCTNNSQYKICIFKLKKEHFVSSSLNISTCTDDAWQVFKKNIIYQRNGNFVISITKCDNVSHSFYANLIKAKCCDCCEAVILYFKYNIISLPSCEQLTNPENLPDVTTYQNFPYNVVCANYESNIIYCLKSGVYKTIRFFNSENYQFTNSLKLCNNNC